MSEDQVVWQGGDLGPEAVQAYLALHEAVLRKSARIIELALQIGNFSEDVLVGSGVEKNPEGDYQLRAVFRRGEQVHVLHFPRRYLETPEQNLEGEMQADWKLAEARARDRAATERYRAAAERVMREGSHDRDSG